MGTSLDPAVTGPGHIGGPSGPRPGPTPTPGSPKQAPGTGGTGPGANANGLIIQPNFDSRIKTITQPLGASEYGVLKRGFMEWDTGVNPPYPKNARAIVNFLYNPSTTSLTYTQSAGSVPSVLAFANSKDQSQSIVPLSQSLNFTLLYDRTYELWGSYQTNGQFAGATSAINTNINNPAMAGVGVDMLAMQQFTGQFVNEPSGAGNGTIGQTTKVPAGNKSDQSNFALQGPIILIPSWVYFGPPVPGNFFYGYITDYEVQVTHWTQYMIPMRCVINIDFAMLPPPVTDQTSGPGEQYWWVKSPLGSKTNPQKPINVFTNPPTNFTSP